MILSKEEYEKYARHIILDKIGIYGQQRLKKAKILFIGAGGLACPGILYLAACGIGNIGIIDYDIISISNLQRQILYNYQDIGKLKTISCQNRLNLLNPSCQVTIYSDLLNYDNVFLIIKNYDVIIDTSDNFATRYMIDEACHKLHKVHIYGAIQHFEGQVSVFNYKSGPKYSDLYPHYLKLANNNCNELGVIGVLPGVIGLLQATETIKIITGLGQISSGYLIVYNALDISIKKIKIQSNQKTNKKYKTSNKKYKNTILCKTIKKQQKNKIIFIDVRQKKEFEEKHIINAINIPLKEIKYKRSIKLLQNKYKHKMLIIYCSYNSRSIIASNILEQHNITHYRLENGFDEWINNY
uniref:Probable molybdopterin-synthase adenylyltransferase n=1 Tax=Riquetophycus sp. TaxID=1897556 RepID=A0A1C9C8C9_9FLOR|nr:molybdopterin biosynthesis protein [Riquetophycus sp.]